MLLSWLHQLHDVAGVAPAPARPPLNDANAFLQAAQSASKSDLCYDDLANVVQDNDSLEFLDEVVPQRVAAEDAAAINAHLKLAQGVAVNSQKKVTALILMLL